MQKSRLAALAAVTACASTLIAGAGIANAQTTPAATPLTQTVAVTGTGKGGKSFTGTYTIQRFVAKGGKLYAVGTLKGKLKNRHVRRSGVMMPATLTQGAQTSQIPPTPNACTILDLKLGPIDLNLLGLRIRTNQIFVLIEGVRGPGNLLGNLLCGITGLLNPPTLGTTSLGQLAQILNAILALSPRTG